MQKALRPLHLLMPLFLWKLSRKTIVIIFGVAAEVGLQMQWLASCKRRPKTQKQKIQEASTDHIAILPSESGTEALQNRSSGVQGATEPHGQAELSLSWSF